MDQFSLKKNPCVELPPELLKALEAVQSLVPYEKGSVLFRQGQPAHGVFILQNGRAKLSIENPRAGELLLRVAGPGCLLGLTSAIKNEPHNFTAELLESAKVGFVHRDELIPHLRRDRELCFQVVQRLGLELGAAYGVMRSVQQQAANAKFIA